MTTLERLHELLVKDYGLMLVLEDWERAITAAHPFTEYLLAASLSLR